MERKKIRTAKLPKIVNIGLTKCEEEKEKKESLRADFIPYALRVPKREWRKFTINNIDQVDPHALVQAMVATFGLERTKDCWEHYCDLKEMLEEITDGDES